MYFKCQFLILAIAIVFSATTTTLSAATQIDDRPESPPVFRVEEIINEVVIQGPDYYVAVDVPVRDNKFLFTIRTAYGDMTALGRNMLELRLREMHAIDQARVLVHDAQLVNGITETLKQTPQGVKILFGDPGGTLLRAPQGLKRMASNLLDSQNRRAGNEERRKLAVQIGCDPETTNPVLMALLDNISVRKSIGKTGSNVGMNVVLPGMGLFSATKSFKDELVNRTPAEINDSIESELQKAGVWEPVARQFCRERSFTTLQRLIFMDHFRALRDVENVQYFVYRATTAYNEVEGLTILEEMKLMRQLHETRGISRIDLQGLPVAMLNDKSVVIVNASDYIRDSQELRDAITAFRRARPNDPTTFMTAGTVSARGKSRFANDNIQVIEKSGRTKTADRTPGDSDRR